MNGIFGVYKPSGITSHDVVNQVRKITGVKRVGHGGTLDPLAEGVLVIAVGRENTRELDKYVKGEKEYVATIKLGFESETDDEEGKKTKYSSSETRSSHSIRTIIPPVNLIQKTLKQFTGTILQTPPAYSAIKVNGKRSYKLARQGQALPLKSREVEIKNIELLSYDYPLLEIKVTTGPGVYIRSLARDIGRKLGTGGYLTRLIRTRVGEFRIEETIKLAA